jgi:hypothetical protein
MNRTFMQVAVLAIVSVAIGCASPPKGTDVGSVPKGTDVASAAKEADVASAPVSDVAYLSAPLEAGDLFGVDSAPGHGGGGHLKAKDHCHYDKATQQLVCDFQADSAPGHGGGGQKAVSDSAPGHGGGGQKAVSDSAPGHGGGGHKVVLLMECKDKDPKRLECTAPVGAK